MLEIEIVSWRQSPMDTRAWLYTKLKNFKNQKSKWLISYFKSPKPKYSESFGAECTLKEEISNWNAMVFKDM